MINWKNRKFVQLFSVAKQITIQLFNLVPQTLVPPRVGQICLSES